MCDISSDSSSISDSSDDDIDFPVSDDEIELFDDESKTKNENYFEEIIPRYTNEEFFEHFRISRQVAESLAQQFKNSQYFKYQSGCNDKLDCLKQIYIYLWFVGHETASFRDVADRFTIAISTLFTIIRRLTHFISNLSNHIITWPSNQEKIKIERHFRLNDFPGVVGVIDGSHIKIDKPANDPDSYLNRKHFYSIQMQVVCDHQRKIRDVFVGYPGSVHDSRVYRTSPLADSLQEKCQHYYILGDSGYPCLPNLLTPFKDRGQLTRRQRNYNLKLAKNRYIIEHCFGILKQKFRQLYHVKLKHIPTIVHLIRACCVIHNLAIQDEFPYVEHQQELHDNVVQPLYDRIEEEDDG